MAETPIQPKHQKEAKSVAEYISSTTDVTTKVNVNEVNEEEKHKLDRDQLEALRAKIIENDRLQANVDKIIEDNITRKGFSNAILTVTVIWMFFILLIVYGVGIGKLNLSDTVLVALITTTTVNVFGFLYVVVNYLFNKDKST